MSMLTTENLSLMAGDKLLMEDLNLSFKPGEIWGILGPNGIGKTTLLHTLAGLKEPHQGIVKLSNDSVHHLKSKKRAQKIGLLLQDSEFPFPSTVLETALLGRYPHQNIFANHKERDVNMAKQSLAIVNLDDYTHRDVNTLSGGEKRRLALATLFTQDPDIFLLDEPTNHLDAEQQLQLLTCLKKQAIEKQKTIIMILHDLSLFEIFCNHMVILGYTRDIVYGKSKVCLETLYQQKPNLLYKHD